VSYIEIEHILEACMGLNAGSIGSSLIERAVQHRMQQCKLAGVSAYLQLIRGNRQELQKLIEAVVVPETWFFRDEKPFAALAEYVRKEWLPEHPNGVLRCLSVPCSTGEEPYSIAMTLLDLGLDMGRFRVDGADISYSHLEFARKGIYRPNAFRNVNTAYRDRYFDHSDGVYHLCEQVRRTVHLTQGNILDPGFVAQAGVYDVVFCRNLLIYFNRDVQQKVRELLGQLLTAKGILFVGHVETNSYTGNWHVSSRYAGAFAVRKYKDGGSPRRVQKPGTGNAKKTVVKVVRRKPPRMIPPAEVQAPHESAEKSGKPSLLDDAYVLADEGRMSETEEKCERYLEQHGPDAAAYYLLGLVSMSGGEYAQAAEYMRKTVYLDPCHYQALIQLAGITEQLGDRRKADLLRQRAQRISEQGEQQGLRI
jgi:chemotaxis protein methyltransferase WspC